MVNTYLRHKQIGTSIYPEVRQTFTYKELRDDFEAVSSAFTGNYLINLKKQIIKFQHE